MVCHLIDSNLFPKFYYILLNIIYICLCVWFVDNIICALFVWREQVHKLWYFLFNPTSCYICNTIILNQTIPPPFVLNIIYICLCAILVVTILCVLFVWRWQVHKLWYFLFNSTSYFIYNNIILNLSHIPPFCNFLFTYLFLIKCHYYYISFSFTERVRVNIQPIYC